MKQLQKLTTAQKLTLVVMALVYPLVLIVPYLIRTPSYTKCAADCVAATGPSDAAITVVGALFAAGVIVGLFRARSGSARLATQYLRLRLLVAVGSIVLWVPVWAYMRNNSPGNMRSIFTNINGELVQTYAPRFGQGVSQFTVVALSAFYLIPALVALYVRVVSRGRVMGLKKEKLFS